MMWTNNNTWQTIIGYLDCVSLYWATSFTINLFLLLFMNPIILFDTIHEYHGTISTNFWIYI